MIRRDSSLAAAVRAAPAIPMPNSIHMSTDVPVRLAALQTATLLELREEWRRLFQSEPPGYSRAFLTARLSYRIQELAYGGLRPQTLARLQTIGDAIDGKKQSLRKAKDKDRPIVGTRLVREWQGVEHTVTVQANGYEWQGRPYKSLSAIARAIAGTRWNGPRFFGLRGQGVS